MARAYGQVTVLSKGYNSLIPAAAATVRAYLEGTATPYDLPLYPDPDSTTPLVFPVLPGDDGVIAFWADLPDRIDVEAAWDWGSERVTLDLEYDPGDTSPFDDRYVNVAGDTMTGALHVSIGGIGTLSMQAGPSGPGLAALNGPLQLYAANGQVLSWADMTLSLGSAANRWSKIWAGDGDLSGSLSIQSKPVILSPDPGNILEWRNNGFFSAGIAGGVSSVNGMTGAVNLDPTYVNVSGDTMTGGLTLPSLTVNGTTFASLLARVSTLETQIAGHTHTSGTIDVMGGTAILP